ncbi:hypothetical protein A2U01_0098841, partial [Trifolium medium]|nr:hypothetical protein [Trifolium medium]
MVLLRRVAEFPRAKIFECHSLSFSNSESLASGPLEFISM